MKTWLLATGAALAATAIVGLAVAPRITATVLAVLALSALAVFYVLACLRRSASVAIVVLLTALLDRSFRGILAFFEVPFTAFITYLDDAVLALALPFTLTYLVRLWRRKRRGARTSLQGVRLRGSQNALRAIPRLAWIGFGVFAASGVISQLVTWTNPPGAITGTWLAIKLPVTVLIIVSLRWHRGVVRPLTTAISVVFLAHAAVSIVEFFAPGVVHQIFGGSRASARLGFSSLKGIFGHPAQSATFCMFVVAMLINGPVSRWSRAIGYAAGALAAATLRVKSLIGIIAVLAVRFFVGGRRITRIIAPATVAAVAGIVALIGWDLIASRFSSVMGADGSPRSALLMASMQISLDRFLFGGGFGSFASEASRSAYSPLWEQYGLSEQYGFIDGNAMFATDLSWATVIGESGFIGAAGMALALGALAFRLIPTAWRRRTTTWHLAALAFLVVVLIDSAASPRLFDGFAAAGLGVLIALTSITYLPAASPPDASAGRGLGDSQDHLSHA
ncbi:hypothetical protein [Microbacterium sp. G2-8]|uniref:hypothetical protein n=1 Tax=Microbacterium sp. G2-8 TaxID=2842454 RepID=UPI001C894C53|nr:hypothetical protein [Microbacterium sp. G2-8]